LTPEPFVIKNVASIGENFSEKGGFTGVKESEEGASALNGSAPPNAKLSKKTAIGALGVTKKQESKQ